MYVVYINKTWTCKTWMVKKGQHIIIGDSKVRPYICVQNWWNVDEQYVYGSIDVPLILWSPSLYIIRLSDFPFISFYHHFFIIYFFMQIKIMVQNANWNDGAKKCQFIIVQNGVSSSILSLNLVQFDEMFEPNRFPVPINLKCY